MQVYGCGFTGAAQGRRTGIGAELGTGLGGHGLNGGNWWYSQRNAGDGGGFGLFSLHLGVIRGPEKGTYSERLDKRHYLWEKIRENLALTGIWLSYLYVVVCFGLSAKEGGNLARMRRGPCLCSGGLTLISRDVP